MDILCSNLTVCLQLAYLSTIYNCFFIIFSIETYLLAVLARKRFVFVVNGAGVSRQLVPLLEAFLAELAWEGFVVVVDTHHVDS